MNERASHWVDSPSADLLATHVQRRNYREGQIRLLVAQMRKRGCPWSVIADVLGTTKQGAQQRYERYVSQA